MGAGSLNKIPSRNLPFTNESGVIHPIWYEYLRTFISDTLESTSGASSPGTIEAGDGLTGGGDVGDGVVLNVGAGPGLKVNVDDIEVDINGQINSSAAPSDELMIVDASQASSIRKTSVQSILDLVPSTPTDTSSTGTPGGSDTQVQYNDGGSLGADADFTTDGTGSVHMRYLRLSGASAGESINMRMVDTSGGYDNKIYWTNTEGLGTENPTSYYIGSAGSIPKIVLASTDYHLTGENDGWLFGIGSGKQIRLKDSTGMTLIGDFPLQRSSEVSITAGTTQTQGQQPLTRDINEISTVANVNDVVTLLAPRAGTNQLVINNGANTLQIFPSSSVDLGAGVDTSVTLAAGSSALFVAYSTTVYVQLI